VSAFLLRRLSTLPLVLLGVSIAVFAMVRLAPGGPAELLLPQGANEAELVELRRALGLDEPVWIQYLIWMGDLLRGDLGRSVFTNRQVVGELLPRFLASAELALLSMTIATLIGVVLGVIAASNRNSWIDRATMLLSLVGISTPVFWLGYLLILMFAVNLGWLPASGRGTLTQLVLPSVTLGLAAAANIARITRSSMLEVLSDDYIRTARGKGVRERTILRRHALQNALIPVVTVMGLQFGALLGGAVLTETVFAWPGAGKLMVDAILARDYPIVQGAVLVFAVAFTVVNILIDLTYAYLDPRIRYT